LTLTSLASKMGSRSRKHQFRWYIWAIGRTLLSTCPSIRAQSASWDGQNGREAMAGSMRQRGKDSWQLRVHAGRDPSTGRKRYVERTFRGTKRDASKALAAMVAEVDQRPVGSHGKGTVAALC